MKARRSALVEGLLEKGAFGPFPPSTAQAPAIRYGPRSASREANCRLMLEVCKSNSTLITS